MPDGAKIKWTVNGSAVTLEPSTDGKSCVVKSKMSGDATVVAYLIDSQGNNLKDRKGNQITDSVIIRSNASIWIMIVYWFRMLLGIL